MTISMNLLYSFLCAHCEYFNCPINITDYVKTELRYGEKHSPQVEGVEAIQRN